jgi:phosphotransferase system IIB component
MNELEFKGTRLKLTLQHPHTTITHEIEEEMDAAGVHDQGAYILQTINTDTNLTPGSVLQCVSKIETWKRPKRQ